MEFSRASLKKKDFQILESVQECQKQRYLELLLEPEVEVEYA